MAARPEVKDTDEAETFRRFTCAVAQTIISMKTNTVSSTNMREFFAFVSKMIEGSEKNFANLLLLHGTFGSVLEVVTLVFDVVPMDQRFSMYTEWTKRFGLLVRAPAESA